jgi:uncharacterized protein (TIGR02147 family)
LFQKRLTPVGLVRHCVSMDTVTKKSASFLKEEYLRRCQGNPSYSQAAFSRDLGLSRGELSEILAGKRPLTLRKMLDIAARLGLSEFEQSQLLVSQSESKSDSQSFDLKKKELLLHPLSLSIFALLDVSGFSWEPLWIAKRLGVGVQEVKFSLEALENAGVIQRKSDGYKVNFDQMSSDDDTPSVLLRNLHKRYLEMALKAVDSQPVAERHFTGISLAVNRKFLPQIKEEISQFLEHLNVKYSKKGKNRDVLYHLHSVFFRIDKGE